jgi:hypothetical protein
VPKIPLFTADAAVTRYTPPMQDPGAMAAPGRALAQLGGAVADIGTDFLQKYAEARQQADAADRVAKASRALSEQEDIYSKADDSIAAEKGYGEAAAKIKAEALKDVTDLRVSNYVGQRIDTETLTRGESVRRQSFGNESSAARGNLEKQLGQYGFQAATGNSPEIRSLAHDNAMAAIKGAAASGYINGERAAAYGLNFNEGAAIGRVRFHMNEALTTEDPELAAYRANALAQDMQKNPEHYEDISAERFGTLADEAARMAHTLQDRYENSLEASDAINRRHTVEAAKDNINSIGASGLPIPGAPTDQQIKDALPKDPVEAEKLIGLTTMAQNGYDASQAMKWTTPAEDNAQAEAFAAKPGILAEQQAQQYNAWVNAQNKKYNALREDPASYVLGNSPETRQAMESAQTPEQMKAALAAQDGLYDRLEVPPDRRAVLTKAQAERSVAQLLDKPENAPAVLDGQQKLFGDRWPRVFQDLTALGKLPPAMQAVGNLMDGKEPTRDAVILARWIAQTKDRQVADLIGSTAKSDIDKNIIANEDVQRFNRSMSLQGLANTQIAGINDGIVDLAYAKRFQDQDASAAEHAVAAFLDKYQFLGAARIPRQNYDAVNRAAAATLNTLKAEQIQIPREYGGDEGKSGPLGPPERFLELVQDSSLWINNPRADGLRLMDIDGKLVRTKDGKPLEIPFTVTPPPGPAYGNPGKFDPINLPAGGAP